MTHLSDHPLLFALEGPAAVVGPSGRLGGWNETFGEWAADGSVELLEGASVEGQGSRGVLVLPDGERCALALSPLRGGGWLAQAPTPSVDSEMARLVEIFGARLEGVDRALVAALDMALREAAGEDVRGALRDALAARDELQAIRRSVGAMGLGSAGDRSPVCMRTLLREVVGQLPRGAVELEAAEQDVTVEINTSHAFAHLHAVLGSVVALGLCVLRVTIGGSEDVRVRVGVAEGWSLLGEDPAVRAASAFFRAQGGALRMSEGVFEVVLPRWRSGVEARRAGGTVLVVDDDPILRAMMGASLRSAGWSVLLAENGVAASALLRMHAHEIALVVADAVLPGRSGMDLVHEAARLHPPIPVLLVSGHPSDLLGVDGLGNVPLLPKPFGARALADTVDRLARVVAQG